MFIYSCAVIWIRYCKMLVNPILISSRLRKEILFQCINKRQIITDKYNAILKNIEEVQTTKTKWKVEKKHGGRGVKKKKWMQNLCWYRHRHRCLIHNHALFAHVDTGLAGAFVRSILEAYHILCLTKLLLGELTLILAGEFGTESWSGVLRVGLALQSKRK